VNVVPLPVESELSSTVKYTLLLTLVEMQEEPAIVSVLLQVRVALTRSNKQLTAPLTWTGGTPATEEVVTVRLCCEAYVRQLGLEGCAGPPPLPPPPQCNNSNAGATPNTARPIPFIRPAFRECISGRSHKRR